MAAAGDTKGEAGGDREDAFPTRMVLGEYKKKVKGAEKGYQLLKKKSDALTVRFRAMLKEIYNTKKDIGIEMKEAAFSLAEAQWAAGNFKSKVLDQRVDASIKVFTMTDNVAGVKLPVFEQVDESADEMVKSLGLAKGLKQIQRSRKKWVQLVSNLIKLASLQTSFIALDEAIKITNRRVNALDNVVIPRLANTKKYIELELDELEKEEIFRTKKVIEVKRAKEAIETADRLKRAKRMDEEAEYTGDEPDMLNEFAAPSQIDDEDDLF